LRAYRDPERSVKPIRADSNEDPTIALSIYPREYIRKMIAKPAMTIARVIYMSHLTLSLIEPPKKISHRGYRFA